MGGVSLFARLPRFCPDFTVTLANSDEPLLIAE